VKEQIEALCAEALGLKLLAKQDDKLARVAGNRFRRGNRFREHAPHLDEIGSTHGLDRLADP
jgi:hypothetical protein